MRSFPVTFAMMLFLLFSLLALYGCGDDNTDGACSISFWEASGSGAATGTNKCWDKLTESDCDDYAEKYNPSLQFFSWHEDKLCAEIPLLYWP